MRQERRKRTRVPVQFDITVSLNKKRIRVETLNLSLTGILCASHPDLKKNETCRVSIGLGSGGNGIRIAMKGLVIRADKREAAIAFTSMSGKSFFHLKKILQYNTEDADTIDSELVEPAFKSFGS